MLESGGLYIVEDLHASYFEDFHGGSDAPFSSINFFKRLTDYVNKEHWGANIPSNSLLSYFSKKWGISFDSDSLNDIAEISFLNSLVLIRKGYSGDNTLGHRLITGTSGIVQNSVVNLNQSKTKKRDEKQNPWGPFSIRLEEFPEENERIKNSLKTVIKDYVSASRKLLDLRDELNASGDYAELERARRKPLKQLGVLIQYRILRSLSKSRFIVSSRAAARFARSAAKRHPLRFTAKPDNQKDLRNSESKFLYEKALCAITTARALGYQAALPEFEKLESAIECCGDRFDALGVLKLEINADEPSRHGPLALPRIERHCFDKRKEVVVYTALFGNYDRLPAIYTENSGVDFVCFTDQEITVPGWKIENRDPMFKDSNLSAKYFKLNPHIIFPEREYSLFVDANTIFLGRVQSLIDRWLLNQNFALWRHPDRDCIFDEAESVILHGRASPTHVARQMSAYEKNGTPRKKGLYECSFLWRRHHDPSIRSFNEAWWKEVTTQTKRDQLSFYHLVHTQGPKPVVLPDKLGTSRANIYFSKMPHEPDRKKRVSKPNQKPSVTFLYDKTKKHPGSTVMRSLQLPAFLQREFGDGVKIQTATNIESVSNSLVIVGKQMLESMSPEALRSLRGQNVALAADPVDATFAAHKMSEFDIIIAASLKALQNPVNSQVSVPHYLITHHSDPRITTMNVPNDRLRVGYFGELANTVGHGQLDHIVDYHRVNTSKANHNWLEQLGNYNAHFAVRQKRDFDGFKPFTKGFVAAHCGAVVLCGRSEGDSGYYLGDDYPFYLDDMSPQGIEFSIAQMTSMFGGQEWKYAREIMEEVRYRSSQSWIAKEFSHMLSEVW